MSLFGRISLIVAIGWALTGGSTRAQYNPRALTQPGIVTPVPDLNAFSSQWPMEVPGPRGQVTIYEPQLESLVGDTVSARAAVSITEPNRDPVFGVVWFKSRIATDRASGIVQFADVTITQTRIPEVDPQTEQALGSAVATGMKSQKAELSLEQLHALLETTVAAQVDPFALEAPAPRILFRDRPTMKIQYDGEPRLMAANNSALQRVANTPFFVVLDPSTKTYYLKGGGVWYEAGDALGPFSRSSRVPPAAIALADETGYKDPQEPLAAAQLERLEIITATEPTELIWTDGPPQMGAVPGTGLLYVTNSDSSIFIDADTQRTYVLLSGRWYEAENRNGPWAYVAPSKLPADFARIPENSERGDVLTHIAGTPQAKKAVADTMIPQTATVSRTDYQQPPVEYDGDPRFEPIEGTASLSYAVNSGQSVVRYDGRYYACYDGVWYVSFSPYGHWDLCTDVPEVIYTIPPSSPIYPVRYVKVYDYTPEYVYTGYTSGYLGSYVYDGVVVYGTGYHYSPWWGSRYYARPYTFGFGAHYDNYSYDWGFSVGFGVGGGSWWLGYGYNSWNYYCDPWFGYGGYRPWSYGYYGHYGYYGGHHHHGYDRYRYDYRHGNEARAMNNRDEDRYSRARAFDNQRAENARRGSNVYDRRSDVQRLERSRGRDTQLASSTLSRDSMARRGGDARNNVLADREGRVFRQAEDGNWERRDNGNWRPEGRQPAALANEPAARRANRSAEARAVSPGTPRVRGEDGGSLPARTQRSPAEDRPRQTPQTRQPEVIRPRASTPEPQARRQGQSPVPRDDRNVRISPSQQPSRTTRTPNQPRPEPEQRVERAPTRSAPRVIERDSETLGSTPRAVERQPAAPRSTPRVVERKAPVQRSAPRTLAREPSVTRSAPAREPRPQTRVQSRPAEVRRSEPQAFAAPRSAPRSEAPTRMRASESPRSSGRFDSMPGRGATGSSSRRR